MNKEDTSLAYTYLWDDSVIITLTLIPKALASTTTDSAGSSVAQPVCRKDEPRREQKDGVVEEHCVFEVWDAGQSAFGVPGDTLQIAAPGDLSKWIIQSVDTEIFGNNRVYETIKYTG